MKYIQIDSPVGLMTIFEDGKGINRIDIQNTPVPQGAFNEETPLLNRAKAQLNQYFNRRLKVFDLPLSLEGTEFQKSVWKQLMEIPYGELRSYGDIAKALSKKGAARAVGMANHNNPVPIIVPCHRVIGSNGKLVGYAGGLDKKITLLQLEGIDIGKT